MEFLNGFKDFLYDRTIYAVASVEGFVIIWLANKWQAEVKARIEDIREHADESKQLAENYQHITGSLMSLVQKTARRARATSNDTQPPPSRGEDR